ncbi:MAG TPA: hypothetical protein VGX00_05645 [Thermoplasmata archaeon]|nr:hypothetical protein [Thermoplasmata archaeon]
MRLRRLARGASAAAAGGLLLASAGAAAASPTDLQQTDPLIWVMLGISIAGAVLTWGIMVYALWKFRDPATKRRRYG